MRDLHQLFDPASSTFTYVLVDPGTRDAVMIDAVDTAFDAYSALIDRDGLRLRYVLETHTHADHITAASQLRESTGAKAATPLACGIVAADLQLEDGEELRFGGETLRALHTPGHTAGSMSYLWRDCVFTGDCLLIGGCGRTDFQSGDAGALYDSITDKLFALPDATHRVSGARLQRPHVVDDRRRAAHERARRGPLARGVHPAHGGAQPAAPDAHGSRGAGEPSPRARRAGGVTAVAC